MCNEAARLRSLGEISAAFSQLKIPLRFPEGLPNLGAAPSIRITDPAVIVRASRDGIVRASRDGIVRASRDGIVRAAADEGDPAPAMDRAAELVVRRWSWPGASGGKGAGKPVYNFRAEGRTFANTATGGRCLIPLDTFFEFTDPGTPADGGSRGRRKDKWAFTAADGGVLGVAGLWRAGVVPAAAAAADGAAARPGRATEAFTMLTCAPGPDIAPYHARQVVIMPPARWADWLGGVVPAAELIAPTPAGTLMVVRAG